MKELVLGIAVLIAAAALGFAIILFWKGVL
jgi:hypothetical protein